MDILSDTLTTLRLRGTVYFQADFGAPWSMEIKGGEMANFHWVVKGQCWFRVNDAAPAIQLNEGDAIVFPHGGRHSLVHSPKALALPSEELLGAPNNVGQRLAYGGHGQTTTLICGHFEIDRRGSHCLLQALPAVIHLLRDAETDWLATASRLAVHESCSTENGANAIVDRLAEVLLIQVVRAYAKTLTDKAGFLAALADPVMSVALARIHAEPDRSWRLPDLADACAVSSTVLVERFNQSLQIAPMQYLTQWRMHKARALLVSSAQSTAQIAQQVGYASEWSFSKAYKRVFNEGPGATRRALP